MAALIALPGSATFSTVAATPAAATTELNLLLSTPSNGNRLSSAPASITLTFDHQLHFFGTHIVVTGPIGVVSTGLTQIDGGVAEQWLNPGLPNGEYIVSYRAQAGLFRSTSGVIRFFVVSSTEVDKASSAARPSKSTGAGGEATALTSGSTLAVGGGLRPNALPATSQTSQQIAQNTPFAGPPPAVVGTLILVAMGFGGHLWLAKRSDRAALRTPRPGSAPKP